MAALGLIEGIADAAAGVARLLWSAVSPLAAFMFLAAAMVIAAGLIATAERASVPAGDGH